MCVVTSGGAGLVAKSCLTLGTQRAVARQARLSMGFSRREYWSGLPFPSPSVCVFVNILIFVHVLMIP